MLFSAYGADSMTTQETQSESSDAAKQELVDCLVPGEVRKLTQNRPYLTLRRPVETTMHDCNVRGGEASLRGQR